MKRLILLALATVASVDSARCAEYQLVAASVTPPAAQWVGGAYTLEAGLAPVPDVEASAAGYTLHAVAPDLYIARSGMLPTLMIRLGSDGTRTISWTDSSARFELELTSELLPIPNWQRHDALIRSGDGVSVSFPPTAAGQARFFRLVAR